MHPGLRKKLDKADPVDALVHKVEYLKASVRAKVEHAFRVIKRQFGCMKVRYCQVFATTPFGTTCSQ